jgi:hypothetical protein
MPQISGTSFLGRSLVDRRAAKTSLGDQTLPVYTRIDCLLHLQDAEDSKANDSSAPCAMSGFSHVVHRLEVRH